LDACAVQAAYGHLLILTSDGALHGIDLYTHASALLCSVDLPEIMLGEDHSHFGAPSYHLHASLDGTYAAIVVDKGRSGVVVETRSGAVTMTIERATTAKKR
jgi:hypothetical protein